MDYDKELDRINKRRKYWKTKVEADKKKHVGRATYKKMKEKERALQERDEIESDYNSAYTDLAQRIEDSKPGSDKEKELYKRLKKLRGF